MEGWPRLEFLGCHCGAAILADNLHAIRRLAAHADGCCISSVSLAKGCSFGVDHVAIYSYAAHVCGGVLHVGRVGADRGIGCVEAAGFDDTVFPVVAVDVQGDDRAEVDHWFGRGKILLGGGCFEPLQSGLFGGIGAKSVFVSLVGSGPKSVAEGFGIVVGRRKREAAFAATRARIRLVAPDAHGDAEDPLVATLFPHERAVVGDGLISVDVVEAIFNEVGLLHARKEQLGLLAVELGLHGAEDRVILGRFGRCCSKCNYG